MQDVDGNRVVIVPDIFKVKAMVDQACLAYTPLGHKDNIFLVLNAFEKLLCLCLSIVKKIAAGFCLSDRTGLFSYCKSSNYLNNIIYFT